MLGHFFTRAYPYPSFNVRDLDSLDSSTFYDIKREIAEMKDWDILIGHVIGVDHAGHTFGPRSDELERKLIDTEKEIEQIVRLMDEDTTLIVFGDHGMTEEGNHGGGTEEEVASVLFAYRKNGMPNKGKGRKQMKQSDIASVLSGILEVPIPFSNLGAFNPDLSLGNEESEAFKMLVLNLRQQIKYLDKYC